MGNRGTTTSSEAQRPGGMPSATRLRHAARLVRRGGVIGYPTEGVYGLGCDPFQRPAVERLLRLKGRPAAKGMILIAASWEQVLPLMAITDEERGRLAEPGAEPVTWLMPAAPAVPEWIRGEHDTVALRITAHPTARALCAAWGGPLVSTSANPAGKAPARQGRQLRRYFGSSVDMVLSAPLGGAAGASEIRDFRSGQIVRPAGA